MVGQYDVIFYSHYKKLPSLSLIFADTLALAVRKALGGHPGRYNTYGADHILNILLGLFLFKFSALNQGGRPRSSNSTSNL